MYFMDKASVIRLTHLSGRAPLVLEFLGHLSHLPYGYWRTIPFRLEYSNLPSEVRQLPPEVGQLTS